ncbi:MAG: 4-hydroxy-tetrahydrodipicolinate reductase, partial [Armatimonadetes bacterium]|nr:4-hydroxy-tetrahydrodipicolinate reductase [Armatimonadota bacterium]
VAEIIHKLVGAVDPQGAGIGVGTLLPNSSADVVVSADLRQTIAVTRPHVMVDFTTPAAVVDNIKVAIEAGVSPVVGTTGIPETRINEIFQLRMRFGLD